MPRKPAHQQVDTLKLIQEQAFELFARYGYDGVSIGDIAGVTGLSKGALYWHYDGKEALYLDCLQRLHALFDLYIFAPIASEQDGSKAILAPFQGLEKLLGDPRVANGVAGYWLVTSGPETTALSEAQRAFEQRSWKVIEAALRRGVDQGQFDLAGDLEEFARAVMSLGEAVILPLRHQTPQEVRQILGVLARTLFRAYAKTAPLPRME
ncbi:MAG TPA: TetR/AcrR family transcriptional regulator [Nevskia sp.]|nr:TetR/AcrR family transcriptional regulator [Nevskia sp.]